VQRKVGHITASQLEKLFNTSVSIKNVNLGLFNQLIIEGIDIEDQQQKPMLHIDKLAASLEYLPLFEGKIVIHTGQIFKINANLYKETADKPDNFQFIIDALSSKEEKKEPSKLNLRINSFIVRDGNISYNQLYKPKKESFDLSHINLQDINAHISLKAFTPDSINARIRELSFKENSGFTLKNLALLLSGNKHEAFVSNFQLELPKSSLQIDSLTAHYDLTQKISIDKIQSNGRLVSPHFTLSDLKAFVPKLAHFNDGIQLALLFQQKGYDFSVKDLSLKSNNNYISLKSTLRGKLPEKNRPISIHANIGSLDLQAPAASFLFDNLALGKVPDILTRLGKTHFEGTIKTNTKSADIDGLIASSLGTVQASANITPSKKVVGHFSSSNFNLSSLLDNKDLGSSAFHINVDGSLAQKIPTGKVTGNIHHLEYKKYRYRDILVNAIYDGKGVNGIFEVNDPNAQVSITGNAVLKQKVPVYNIHANIAQIDMATIGFSQKDAIYQGELYANCSGNNIDDLLGSISLQNFQMTTPETTYKVDSLVIHANKIENKNRLLALESDFLHATVEGEYQYSTIVKSFTKILERYIPSLLNKHTTTNTHNNFSLSAKLTDATPLQQILDVPLELQEDITISGEINDVDNIINLDVSAGKFIYDGQQYELGKITCDSNGDQLQSSIGVNRITKKNIMTLGVQASAKDDNVYTDITWDNNKEIGKFNGKISTRTRFQKVYKEPLNINVSIQPSETIINDTVWHVLPSMVDYRDKKILISALTVENGPRHLIVNGIVGNEETDTIKADLQEINLEYVFDALNFHPVELAGIATGKAIATNVLKDANADANLFVRNFHFENGLLGNMNLRGRWDKEEEGIYLNGYVSEFASESNDSIAIWKAFNNEIDASALTHIEGIISPKHDKIDLHIDAQKTNIHFLESFIGSIFKDIQGRATGWARVGGSLHNIDLTGNLKLDAQVKAPMLNTVYKLKSDSIVLLTNKMNFNAVQLIDKDGHIANGHGSVNHYYLHDFSYDFNIETNNLLCYDFPSFDDGAFAATAFVNGNVSIVGQGNVLNVNGDLETMPGTFVGYNASTPEDITDTGFITFVDKTPISSSDSILLADTQEEALNMEEEESTNIYINLNINCTPDATIRVLMDRISGDDITCHGNGNLRAQYFNKGAFNLYGIFNIERGAYKMSLQEVIRKDFNLNSGTITFNGKPFDGQLDVQAVYTVNSAALRDLSPSATFSQKSTTRVNILMNLTGTPLKPNVAFDLELPNVTDEDQAMVRSLVATEDQMNRQIIYLLGIGRFYTDEYDQDSNQANQAMNSLLTSTLSGQFSQILNQIANSNNWNFGANLNPGQDGLNNMEFQTMLSGSLFNNRLLINGNFGYRENALANTNFVGDFDLQWLLNQSGTISLKAYNETNDRYFTKNTLNTQGIGILFKRDFQHWSELFRWSRKKKAKEKENAADSTKVLKSEFIQFGK